MHRQPHLLVVEDDPDAGEALGLILSEQGFSVTLSTSRERSIELVNGNRFDLIVTDLFEGSLEDAEILVRAAAPVPVGLLTGWSIDPTAVRRRGFAFSLLKPPDLSRLMQEIASALGAALPAQHPKAQIAAAYFGALTRRDWDGLVSLCTADVRYVLPGEGPFARSVSGREAFRRFTEKTFAEFPEAAFEDVIAFETPLGLAARYVGTYPAADGRRSLAGTVVLEMREGAICRIGVQLNQQRLAALSIPG